MNTTQSLPAPRRSSLRSALAVAGLLLVWSLAPAAFAASDAAESADTIQPALIGATAPNVAVTTLDGAETKLHDVLLGKKTVLIFYRGGW